MSTFKRHVFRALVAYLVSAAVETIVLSVQFGPSDAGWGSLAAGALLTFWAIPLTCIYDMLSGNAPPEFLLGILWFFATLPVAAGTLYRREIATLIEGPG